MEDMYFTIAGCNHYFGNDFMEKETIQVKIKGLGQIGYVANSPYTVKGESMSAGRLYDKIADKANGKILFIVEGGAVCEITDTGK